MKQTLIIIFTLFTFQLFACTCGGWNKENIDKLRQKADYIFIGTVVDNIKIDNNEFLNYQWKTKNYAEEVVIKVDEIIKGKLESGYVYISQFNQGNCSRFFRNGEKYIITGSKVKKFIDLNPQKKNEPIEEINNQIETDEIPEIVIELSEIPEIEFKRNKFYVKNLEGNFKNWNELAETKTVILTNVCVSGSPNSPFWNLIMN